MKKRIDKKCLAFTLALILVLVISPKSPLIMYADAATALFEVDMDYDEETSTPYDYITIDANLSILSGGIFKADNMEISEDATVKVNSGGSLILNSSVNVKGTIIVNGGTVNSLGSTTVSGGTIIVINGNFTASNTINVENGGALEIENSGKVSGNVKVENGNLTVSGVIDGILECGTSSVYGINGKVNGLVCSNWGNGEGFIGESATINSINVTGAQQEDGVISTLNPNTSLTNNSGSSILFAIADNDECLNVFALQNGLTFSYSSGSFSNICNISSDFGDMDTNEESSKTISFSNPFPQEVTVQIKKDAIYPFIFPEENNGTALSDNQYIKWNDSGTGSGSTDAYFVKIPANSNKSVKVSVDSSFSDFGKVQRDAGGSVLLLIPNNGEDSGTVSYAQLEYNGFEKRLILSADISQKSNKKIDGTGSISVKNVYYGKTPVVNITSKTNNASKATILYTGTGYSSANAPKAPGTYKVTATLPENDEYNELVVEGTFKIEYLPAPNEQYTISGTEGLNGFYKGSITINAPEGYKISTSLNGEYTDSVQISEESNVRDVYFINANGEMTDGYGLGTIKIDSKDPLVSSDSKDGSTTAIISVSDDNLDKIYVNGKEVSFTETKKDIELTIEDLVSEEMFEIKAVDKAGRETTYTITLEAEWFKTGIIPKGAKVKDTKGKKMTLGEGVTGVEGDSSVYVSGVTVYASEDGELRFK